MCIFGFSADFHPAFFVVMQKGNGSPQLLYVINGYCIREKSNKSNALYLSSLLNPSKIGRIIKKAFELTKMMTFAKKSAYLTPLANPSTISRSPAANRAASASVTVSHLTYRFPILNHLTGFTCLLVVSKWNFPPPVCQNDSPDSSNPL